MVSAGGHRENTFCPTLGTSKCWRALTGRTPSIGCTGPLWRCRRSTNPFAVPCRWLPWRWCASWTKRQQCAPVCPAGRQLCARSATTAHKRACVPRGWRQTATPTVVWWVGTASSCNRRCKECTRRQLRQLRFQCVEQHQPQWPDRSNQVEQQRCLRENDFFKKNKIWKTFTVANFFATFFYDVFFDFFTILNFSSRNEHL